MRAIHKPAASNGRLGWLDIARILCAMMILGIHWLRAAFKVSLFGASDSVNLVTNYQGHSGGLRLFDYILIGGTAAAPSTWLTNAIGLLGGFGWEAVSALILISGFSLALSQRGRSLSPSGWFAWYGKRAKRILIPFYIIAVPFLALYVIAVVTLPHVHSHFASIIESKLLSQFHTPPLGVILSHTVLFDPYAHQWSADFFAPAWWFVPAILLAYAAYPFFRSAGRVAGGIPLLASTGLITIGAYIASDAGFLDNEQWYFIVLHESFNFCLGIVVAQACLSHGREAIERVLFDRRIVVAAIVCFVIGNIANWSPGIRPVASMLYGPSLVVIVIFIAKLFEGPRVGRALASVDSYDLYLVHQPFAFPIALFAKAVFHDYAVFVGWFIFLGFAWVAARLLGAVHRFFFLPRANAAPASGVSRFMTGDVRS